LQHRHLRAAEELIGRRKMPVRQPRPDSVRTSSLRPGAPPAPRPEREEDGGRRVLLEAPEEDPARSPPDVQTARFIRLSERRPQHQACHPFVAAPAPLFAKFQMDPRTAVMPPALLMDSRDVLSQLHVLLRLRRLPGTRETGPSSGSKLLRSKPSFSAASLIGVPSRIMRTASSLKAWVFCGGRAASFRMAFRSMGSVFLTTPHVHFLGQAHLRRRDLG
jgi:hypothetical protein